MSGKKLEVNAIQGSILEVEAQVVVNAANSLAFMGEDCSGHFSTISL